MQTQVIEIKKRENSGKTAARKDRQAGRVPGILYGHKQEPFPFTIDPHDLLKKVRSSGMGRNTVFKVVGAGRELTALIKDSQSHPLKHTLLHVDLIEVRESDRIVVEVPVELIGKPEGVIAGGVLQAVRRTIAVECSPVAIPQKITADVTHLHLNQALHVNDIKFPDGTKSGYPPGTNFAVATVQPPRAEEEVKPATAEGAEGVPVEGAEGAVAAAPGAAGAAAGAAAPAAAEGKKAEKGGKEKK
jgi:large subunit ribosomal protein L25